MLTGDNGTFTIQDMKLVSLAYKTLCDLWVHVSKLENVLAKDFKDCIISTRKMVTCPKLHKFSPPGNCSDFQRMKWSTVFQHQIYNFCRSTFHVSAGEY